MVLPKDKDISHKFLLQIGENIKKRRKKKGLTLEKLGLEIGLTRMQVNRIENGYNITMKTLLKVSIALGVKPEDLVKFVYKTKKEDLEGLVNNNKSNKKQVRNYFNRNKLPVYQCVFPNSAHIYIENNFSGHNYEKQSSFYMAPRIDTYIFSTKTKSQ